MSYHVYPLTATEPSYLGYEIKINGQSVTPDTARVSKMPFNRRWPGHQRDIAQSEPINFLSLETDGPVHFEITPREPFQEVAIRPTSLGIRPELTADGRILFTLERPAYFTVEPYGRHNALHIFADPVSHYTVHEGEKNVRYFGRGTHEVGLIELKSGETLFLDEGAVVYACVYAKDAENIRILGRGILDNSHNREEILFEAHEEGNTAAVQNVRRRHTVQLEYCTDVRIEGITIRDSLVYNIRPIACRRLQIENVKIIGCWRFNSDGIDMHNCEDVRIRNCFLRTFDDSICVKGFDCYYAGDVEEAVREAMYRNGESYDTFRDVRVENCVIWNDWGKCLEIGAETRAEEISDILFENCDIIHTTGAVLDCENVDYATVHDVTYRNIRVEYDPVIPSPQIQERDAQEYVASDPDYAPAVIAVLVTYHPEYSAGGRRRGKNERIHFENIHLLGRQTPLLRFAGYDAEHTTSSVTVKGFYQNGRRLSAEELSVEQNEFCKDIAVL